MRRLPLPPRDEPSPTIHHRPCVRWLPARPISLPEIRSTRHPLSQAGAAAAGEPPDFSLTAAAVAPLAAHAGAMDPCAAEAAAAVLRGRAPIGSAGGHSPRITAAYCGSFANTTFAMTFLSGY